VAGQGASSKPAEEHKDHGASSKPVENTNEKPEKFVIPDVTVTDQDGRQLKFYTDLVKDKKVIVNFIFTSCNGICPTTGGQTAKLQTALGKRLGTDVFLITVTTDPETDTPERLKAWGKRYNPAAGWTLVTGSFDNITRLLQLFTGDGKNTGYHVPAVCIVDDVKKSQKWTYALSPIEEILGIVDGK
jgi:cytochrome oxidase Cu insertion factor (SCO1/SenC/PrrC family)